MQLYLLCLLAVCLAVCGGQQTCKERESFLPEMIKSTQVEERFLLFDIRGKLSEEDVNDAFDGAGVDVIYKFKTYGGRRFIVVTWNDQSRASAYAKVDIPKADSVEVHTAEFEASLSTYLGFSTGRKDLPELPDENLMLIEIRHVMQGLTLDQYKTQLVDLFSLYSSFGQFFPSAVLHTTARLPSTILMFRSVSDVILDRIYLEGSRALVGPSQYNIKTTPIVNFRKD